MEPAVELGIHKEVKGSQKFSSRVLDTLIKTFRLELRPDFKHAVFLLKQIYTASFSLGPVAATNEKNLLVICSFHEVHKRRNGPFFSES